MRRPFFLIFCHFAIRAVVADSGCTINPFEVDLLPLIVISGASNFIYLKWGEDVLRFDTTESVDFICPGRKITIGSLETQSSLLTASCIAGTVFKINNRNVEWNQLRCSKYPDKTLRDTGNTCANNGREVEVGFDTGDNRFLRFLLICFNEKLQIAYYTYFDLPASINQGASNIPRPSWLQGSGLYSIPSINNLYERKSQKPTINELLGLPENSTKYIQDTTNYFLSRGHMTAKADGFYAAQQNSTFFIANVAPQWQTFNAGNWVNVETNVRDYASANGVDLQIWTGIYGISTLPHEETGEETELYLFVNETTKALPVPEIYWKVAYNPITEKGIVLIGVNNPYISTFVPICEDISNNLTWLSWKKTDQRAGFSYACSIPIALEKL